MTVTITIVGRPNVGKSTLFNRLIGKKLALVDDQPGVTRDLREAKTKFKNSEIKIIDTAGLENGNELSLQGRMTSLSLSAIENAHVCLFVIDVRAGVTTSDNFYASLIRKTGKQVILVANKVEGSEAKNRVYEAFSLGLGNPVAISAEHGTGIDTLKLLIYELVQPFFRDENRTPSEKKEIKISIIGRPNSGKSTLINLIVGNQKLLTGPEAGITRDAISSSVNWFGEAFRIFDTAGMRKKAKIKDKLERMSVSDGIRAIKFSEIIVLLLDVKSPFDSQDLRIADLSEREGRCVVIAINKWDLEKEKSKRIIELREKLTRLLPQLLGVPLVPVSALAATGLANLNKEILLAYKLWNVRIPTSELNNWLAKMINAHPPPALNGKRMKMRYITQVKSRPPSFVIFSSRAESIPESYKRYLINGIRRDFGIRGVPIRLILRSGNNPYNKAKK